LMAWAPGRFFCDIGRSRDWMFDEWVEAAARVRSYFETMGVFVHSDLPDSSTSVYEHELYQQVTKNTRLTLKHLSRL
jgi:hypothetical protein